MNSTEITLQVYHRHFKIPIKSYLNTVSEFLDPWEERAYQHFVHQYLQMNNDEGIVGMVRQEKDENHVYLDAAVRYPMNHSSANYSVDVEC